MYVNINRYYKIYYKYPPSIIYLPRANARKKRKEKKEKFAPRSVKICETTLTFLLFFFFFGSFFCYCRNFSVIFTLGEDTFVRKYKEKRVFLWYFAHLFVSLPKLILLHNSKVFKLLNNYPPPVVRFVEVFYARPTVLFKLERLWSLMQNKGVTLQDFEKRALFVSK